MTTDLEFLRAAANAAGITIIRSRLDDPMHCDLLITLSVRNPHHDFGGWNPLTDDGDALRLAVKLGIDVSHNTFGNVIADHYTLQDKRAVVLAHGIDPCAATRRAIVALAAKMSPLPAVG